MSRLLVSFLPRLLVRFRGEVILLALVICCHAQVSSASLTQNMSTTPPDGAAGKTESGGNDTFMYFAFGSNLNSKRIHVNNPSARRVGVGLLKEYRLDFGRYSERWKGAVATVVPDKDEHVWGAIWAIDSRDMDNLDKQEGVERQIYRPFFPNISIPTSDTRLVCRCYELTDAARAEIATDTRPSVTYLDLIVKGAVESGLPADYVEKLRKIESNGETVEYTGERKIYL